jgi:uncharacterized protein (TIGR02284 family)
MTNENTITIINNLTETCLDGQFGYKEAAEGIEDSAMKNVFYRLSQQRAKFAGELQQIVRDLGGEPEDTTSFASKLHRSWISIKSAVTSQDEVSVLKECVRGEESAVKAYQIALDSDLPSNLNEIITRQFTEVKEAYQHVNSMNAKKFTATV